MGEAMYIVRSWPKTPIILVNTFFKRRDVAALIADKAKSGADMKRTLGWFQLCCMGIGAIIGAGIFVITGVVANQTAGPAVCLSFVVGGVCAMLSSLVYSEFSTELPVAGSSFTYVLASMGQFPAFLVTANMIMEYVLSIAAIARGWSGYLATLCNQESDAFRIHVGWADLDPIAVGIIVILTTLICLSTKESSRTNLVLVITKLLGVVFVIVAGFTQAKPGNFTADFAPYGLRGIFNGAAIIFFAYLGYDAVATLAEEARNPGRDMPLGIISATGVCTILYIIMCIVICMMVPYADIDINAPFSSAFGYVGLTWAKFVVAAMALVGITTALLVNMLGQARIWTMAAREHMIPGFWARVSARFGTPYAAQITMGGASAIIGFFTSLDILANMVSIGTLFAFFMVASSLFFYKTYDSHVNDKKQLINSLVHMLLIWVASLGLACYYALANDWYGIVAFLAMWVIVTASAHIFCKVQRTPRVFASPLFPWVPSGSMILNAFLLSTLDRDSYIRFGIWSAFCICFYLVYSIHSIEYHHSEAEKLPMHSNGAAAAPAKEVDQNEKMAADKPATIATPPAASQVWHGQ